MHKIVIGHICADKPNKCCKSSFIIQYSANILRQVAHEVRQPILFGYRFYIQHSFKLSGFYFLSFFTGLQSKTQAQCFFDS
ncbi:unknown [Porcine lymphotropic herpesvirus 2]|uniref:Uncharacterized protein n=1 Tax=Suid gammaherpesvirus 4 TaxID=1960250 RepID=Q8B3X2_9GAMA|nr:unknown [Porcine lymphotropic herpesvirus 2]AAO12358.1 unknown [Porcine lymphotropic herpesvirus 2]